MRATALDEKFLVRFARESWERKPLVLRQVKTDLVALNDGEVFKLVVKAADRSRRERKLLGFKFYVQGVRSSDVEALYVLPRKSDRDFHGYNERMERLYQDYCLVCDELLQVNGDKQHLLTDFLYELYRQVGFPNRFAEMGLYLGNYRKTPFGVHRDDCGVFSFPVVGKKVFRAWTSSYAAKNPSLKESFRYSRHKAKSKMLEAQVGDLIYWPSSSWHIAESDGSFSVTWSLGIWIDHPTRDVIGETLLTLIANKMDDSLQSGTIFGGNSQLPLNGEAQKLPAVFQKSISALKALTRDELEAAFLKVWLKRFAEKGLKTQAEQESPFRLGAILRLRSSPILWALDLSFAGKFKFHFAYGGSGLLESTSKNLLRLIQDANSGESCALENYRFQKTRSADLASLRTLGKAGAFLNTQARQRTSCP